MTGLDASISNASNFDWFDGPCRGYSKKWRLPVGVFSARYSSIKGERIVCWVLSIRLLECLRRVCRALYAPVVNTRCNAYGPKQNELSPIWKAIAPQLFLLPYCIISILIYIERTVDLICWIPFSSQPNRSRYIANAESRKSTAHLYDPGDIHSEDRKSWTNGVQCSKAYKTADHRPDPLRAQLLANLLLRPERRAFALRRLITFAIGGESWGKGRSTVPVDRSLLHLQHLVCVGRASGTSTLGMKK